MKLHFWLLLTLVACSSTPEKKKSIPPEKVTNEAFKKDKALNSKDVPDFYNGKIQAINPALQDETIDRFAAPELASMEQTTDPLLSIAINCLQGDFNQGFSIASKNFDKYQKVAVYWNLIGNCHLNQGSHRKALLFYNKALEVSANYVPALNNIGVLYFRQGQEQKALIAFERASSHAKFAKTPRYNLAKLYLRFGLAESALPLFQGLLSSAPQDVDLLNAVASAYFLMSDYQRAQENFSRIPKEQWENPEIGLNLAMTLKKLGRNDEAKEVFSSVAKPKNGELKRYHAVIAAQLGEKS